MPRQEKLLYRLLPTPWNNKLKVPTENAEALLLAARLCRIVSTCFNVDWLIELSSAAEEACLRLPGEVCRGAAGPGFALHQHLPASPEGGCLILPHYYYFCSTSTQPGVSDASENRDTLWFRLFTAGPKPVHPGQCAEGFVQYPCPHHCPHHDVGHQGGCSWPVSICEEDFCPRYSEALQVQFLTG